MSGDVADSTEARSEAEQVEPGESSPSLSPVPGLGVWGGTGAGGGRGSWSLEVAVYALLGSWLLHETQLAACAWVQMPRLCRAELTSRSEGKTLSISHLWSQ